MIGQKSKYAQNLVSIECIKLLKASGNIKYHFFYNFTGKCTILLEKERAFLLNCRIYNYKDLFLQIRKLLHTHGAFSEKHEIYIFEFGNATNNKLNSKLQSIVGDQNN